MKTIKFNRTLLSASCLLAISFLVTPSLTQASVVTGGSAALTLNQAGLANLTGTLNTTGSNPGTSGDSSGHRYMYVETFFADSAFSYATLNNATPATTPYAPTTQTQPFVMPVVTAANKLPNVGGYQIQNITSTFDPSNDSGVIGLAGAFKMVSDLSQPTSSVRWGKFDVAKVGGTWSIFENFASGTALTGPNGSPIPAPYHVFDLVNATENYDANTGAFSLSGSLVLGPGASISDWGNFLGLDAASKATTVGSFSITTVSAVPVPAAAWLFGSAIIGLTGIKRRNKAAIAAV